jgi:hypothetical protein
MIPVPPMKRTDWADMFGSKLEGKGFQGRVSRRGGERLSSGD